MQDRPTRQGYWRRNLIYVGLTRATTHVVAVAPEGLAKRLRNTG